VKALAALAVGYALGSRSGRKELDELVRALKRLTGTEEFSDVVVAARAQLAASLRELAAVVDAGLDRGDEEGRPRLESEAALDLVARVSRLVRSE